MTKKGERCKREAPDGAAFCAIHVDQEVRTRSAPCETEWDRDALLKAALGFAVLGAILFLRIRR
jgi:hypothetical protein